MFVFKTRLALVNCVFGKGALFLYPPSGALSVTMSMSNTLNGLTIALTFFSLLKISQKQLKNYQKCEKELFCLTFCMILDTKVMLYFSLGHVMVEILRKESRKINTQTLQADHEMHPLCTTRINWCLAFFFLISMELSCTIFVTVSVTHHYHIFIAKPKWNQFP